MPRWLYAAVPAVVGVALAVFLVGEHDAQARRIPADVASGTVERVTDQSRQTATIDRGEASRLVQLLNRLPRFPSGELSCPGSDDSYEVRLQERTGSVVDVQIRAGCRSVDVRTDGNWWGWDHWERDGAVVAEIRKDLAAAKRG